jgi:hypothetical protein
LPWKEFLEDETVQDRLKHLVENAVMDAWVRTHVGNVTAPDDPFDAVYISSLSPDPIAQSDIATMRRLSNMVDLSEHLAFDDDWE